jgi:hypothetical protein
VKITIDENTLQTAVADAVVKATTGALGSWDVGRELQASAAQAVADVGLIARIAEKMVDGMDAVAESVAEETADIMLRVMREAMKRAALTVCASMVTAAQTGRPNYDAVKAAAWDEAYASLSEERGR